MTTLTLLATLLLCQGGVEGTKREQFSKDYKDKDSAKRADAVWRMSGCSEEVSIQLLVPVFKDPAMEVRKAIAGVLAECTDHSGATIKPLCAWLLNKKEESALRLQCAKTLRQGEYRAEAIDALIQTISGIGEAEKDLYQFGADCTKILGELAGQDFGTGKETPDKWKTWWKLNQAKIVKEDQLKLAAWKKSPKGK